MWGSKGYTSIDIEEKDEQSYHSNTKWLHTNPIISCCIVFILILVAVVLSCWVFFPRTGDIIEKEGQTMLNVKLASSNRYLTADQHGRIFTTPFPWLNGSRFKLQQLQSTDSSSSNKYQLISVVTGEVITLNSHTNELQALLQHYNYKTVYLSSDMKKYDLSPAQTVSFISNLHMTEIEDTSNNANGVSSYGNAVKGNTVNIRSDNSYSNALSSTFLIEPMQHIKGVNIGSWFIPERWMYPEFYEGVEPFFSQLCGLVSHLGFEVSETRMKQHLDTWFTTEDFDRLIESDIQSIRLPIGFWNLVRGPYDVFVPRDINLSLKYLDWAMNEAEKRGMSVMLDMHGAPGSQNGYDHSGCGYDSTNGQGWNTPANRNLTLRAIEVIASRYGNRSNLLGIEILNEPALDLEKNHHDDLLHFYQSAYHIIRRYSPSTLMVVNILWDDYYDVWIHELLEPEYYNIVYDWHKYEFDALVSEADHLKKVEFFHAQIKNHSTHHPLLIGEWSGTLGMNSKQPVDQPFITAQINTYNDAWGWYYWNFKVLQKGFLVWSLEDLIDQGYDMGFHDSPPSVYD